MDHYAIQKAIVAGMQRTGLGHGDIGMYLARMRFPARAKLLGSSQKVIKGEKVGVLTAILYLAPHRTAERVGVKRNACESSSAGCRACCLGCMSPRLKMSTGRNAKLWKSALYYWAPATFNRQLFSELRAHEAKAQRKGLIPAVRLDGCSDTGMAEVLRIGFPGIMFYDYTKDIARVRRWVAARRQGKAENYHLTFSWSGVNAQACAEALANGVSVAVPFRNPEKVLAAGEWSIMGQTAPVIDGDVTDYRPADPRGCIVVLSVKGQGIPSETHGFIVG